MHLILLYCLIQLTNWQFTINRTDTNPTNRSTLRLLYYLFRITVNCMARKCQLQLQVQLHRLSFISIDSTSNMIGNVNSNSNTNSNPKSPIDHISSIRLLTLTVETATPNNPKSPQSQVTNNPHKLCSIKNLNCRHNASRTSPKFRLLLFLW